MFMHHIGGGVGHSFVNLKQGIEGSTATNDGHEDDNIRGAEEGDDDVIDYEDDLNNEDDLADGEEVVLLRLRLLAFFSLSHSRLEAELHRYSAKLGTSYWPAMQALAEPALAGI